MKHCSNHECPDFHEMGRASEYEDFVTTCSACGTDLAEGAVPETRWEARELVMVYTSRESYQVALVRAALEGAGIQAIVEHENLVCLPFGCLPEVWVPASQSEPASQVVRDVLREAESSHRRHKWRCGQCDATVSGDLVRCWKCTTPRPRKKVD